jgi:hypothetical protein
MNEIVASSVRNVGRAASPLLAKVKATGEFRIRDAYSDEESGAASILLSLFSRFVEIACNVFFYAYESSEFGGISASRTECLCRMKAKGIITDPAIWTCMVSDAELSNTIPLSPKSFAACNRIIVVYSHEIEGFINRIQVSTGHAPKTNKENQERSI